MAFFIYKTPGPDSLKNRVVINDAHVVTAYPYGELTRVHLSAATSGGHLTVDIVTPLDNFLGDLYRGKNGPKSS